MEIKFNSDVNPIPATTNAAPAKARTVSSADPAPQFEGARALEEALAATPDIRSEKVQEGQALTSMQNYPPMETMAKIARLLAVEM